MTRKYRWIDIIDDLVESYNNTVHTTIKMRPADVTAKHTPEIIKRLYPKRKTKSPKFAVGDEVRAVKPRKTFDKRSRSMWLPETFNVVEIKNTNPVTYKVEHDGHVKVKTYYSAELQKVK